jgi:hypothetical protein
LVVGDATINQKQLSGIGQKPQFLFLNSWGIWEIWRSDEMFLILICVLANSDLELVKLEVTVKP